MYFTSPSAQACKWYQKRHRISIETATDQPCPLQNCSSMHAINDLPLLFLPHNTARPFLFPLLAALHHQPIELEKLTNDCLSLFARAIISTRLFTLELYHQSFPEGHRHTTYLHHLQLPQPVLHQFLHTPLVRFPAVLPKGICGPPPGVFAEIVVGELLGLAEEGAVEGADFGGAGGGGHARAVFCRWQWDESGSLREFVRGDDVCRLLQIVNGGCLCHFRDLQV